MRVETLNQSVQVTSVNTVNAVNKDFREILDSEAISTELDAELRNMTKQSFYKVPYSNYKKSTISIGQASEDEIDTGRYQIRRSNEDVEIYDKKTQQKFGWILRYGDEVQVDSQSNQKFLINDFGNGFFMMQCVDDELENGLKKFFDVDELPEKELTGFTVQTDKNTGIKYVTADGYEWQGGQIIFTDDARKKLQDLSETYMKDYPGRIKSYDDAFFYATFEVRGLVKRTSDGFMMLGRDNVTFKGNDEKEDWTVYFDTQLWEMIKDVFDSESDSKEMFTKLIKNAKQKTYVDTNKW